MRHRRLAPAFLLAALSIVCSLVAIRAQAQTQIFQQVVGGGGSGDGTVTSVAATVPTEITLTGSPITGAGTLAFSWTNQLTSRVFAAPCGTTGTPTFRVLCAADIPTLDPSKITGTAVVNARTITAGTNLTGGGDLSANRTVALATTLTGLASVTSTAFVGALTGNSSTSTALAANPADCSSNQFATTIAASGNLTCAGIVDADVPNTITVDTATTAGALAANGTNCGAGNYPLGVDAAGNAEGCTSAGGGSTLPVVDTTALVEGSGDGTKEFRIEIDGIPTSTTVVMTPPPTSFTAARTDAGQTLNGPQVIVGGLEVQGAINGIGYPLTGWFTSVFAKTGNASIQLAESLGVITNAGAGVGITITLRAAFGGAVRNVITDDNASNRITLKPDTGNTLIWTNGTAISATGSAVSTARYNTVEVVAINSTHYVALSSTGTWTITP